MAFMKNRERSGPPIEVDWSSLELRVLAQLEGQDPHDAVKKAVK